MAVLTAGFVVIGIAMHLAARMRPWQEAVQGASRCCRGASASVAGSGLPHWS